MVVNLLLVMQFPPSLVTVYLQQSVIQPECYDTSVHKWLISPYNSLDIYFYSERLVSFHIEVTFVNTNRNRLFSNHLPCFYNYWLIRFFCIALPVKYYYEESLYLLVITLFVFNCWCVFLPKNLIEQVFLVKFMANINTAKN